jgi:hemerythrin-like domain-containing protein
MRGAELVAQGASDSRADTRVYEVVHDAFRLATTRLTGATEKLEPSVLRGVIGERWAFYAAVLHHHHHNEDDSIFPALVAVRPDMDTLIQKLESEHQQLIGAMQAVDAALSAFEQQPDAPHQESLHDAMLAVRDMFIPHLDVEDAQILPAIAESVPPKEWDRIDKAALKSIPREQLPLAVGSLDEIIQGMAKAQQPPPPPPPIRLMLTLSWRKKWSAWVEPLRV